jgi:hypothetical protein
MRSQITSTISMVWDFTTKSGGIWKILIEQAYFSIQGLSEPRTLEDDGPVRPREDGGH